MTEPTANPAPAAASTGATKVMRVTLVTVTYGDRWHLLSQALASAFAEGIARAVVVDNGSRASIAARCEAAYGDRVRVIAHPRNLGSAPGFRAGIEAACAEKADRVLLLDDDNRLERGALGKLLDAHRAAAAEAPARALAVVGFRPANQTDIGAGKTRQALHVNAFFGFHLKHLPRKVWQRLPRLKKPAAAPTRPIPRLGLLDFAPYSGMLFDPSLIDLIGLPDPNFVLYADDTEFSYRVTRLGGQLLVVTDARVADIEPSWNTKRLHSSAFAAWLAGGSDLSVYYAARNRACFEAHSVAHSGWIRGLNRGTFLLVMRVLAARLGKRDRYRLFCLAVDDGEAQRLGVKHGFELT